MIINYILSLKNGKDIFTEKYVYPSPPLTKPGYDDGAQGEYLTLLYFYIITFLEQLIFIYSNDIITRAFFFYS